MDDWSAYLNRGSLYATFERDGSARKCRETNRFAILSAIFLSDFNLRSFSDIIYFFENMEIDLHTDL